MAAESGPGRSLLVQRMMKKGIQIICGAKVEKVEKDKLYYSQKVKSFCLDEFDSLILAMGYRPDTAFTEMLK